MHVQQMTGSMTPGYKALTEREKQTLRLLLDGHDAKSMARHLGLSVHTINERLRDARRKLAVSSSKEAARLLRRAEGGPETLGDRHLGDADPAKHDQQPVEPGSAPPSRRPMRWAIGGLAMIAIVATILALTVPESGLPSTQAPSTSPPAATSSATDAAVVQAAREWLELGDASKWDEALAATGASFHAANTLALWRSTSEKVRVPLGRMRSRTLIDAQEVPTPPNGGWMVRFRTDFANKSGAVETLSLAREDNAWKVVGIYLE
jgi:DNA-binding CsgD family transcriptional regulator